MRKVTLFCMMVLWCLVIVTTASPGLAAYSSHQNDQDINNFLTVYPFARGTKLDDCALCHKGDVISGRSYNSCDYCHQTYGLQPPHGDLLSTLNPYGLAYNHAGRNQQALIDIGGEDSDGDGYPNTAEINALAFPGDKTDYPGLIPAPAIVLNQERILQLPNYSQFLLHNATKDKDWYARYCGVKMKDLLNHVGIRPEATKITVFAPDGFSKSFPMDAPDPQTDPSKVQYDVMGPYPRGKYYQGLDFVQYSFFPRYLVRDDEIPDTLYMLLAYLRDGNPLTTGKLVPDPNNPARLVLNGEGPYRVIPPQKIAGSPDRPSTSTPVGDGWDYSSSKDHNAGSSVRSVAAIRVDPLPPGTTDFQWTEGGWNLVDQAKLVIYGAIDPPHYGVEGMVFDSSRHPISDVKITFGLLSLGQVGEAFTSGRLGKFQIDLPAGEYTLVPSKDGCTFIPASLSISIAERGPDQDHGLWYTASSPPDYNFTASCVP